MKKIKLLTIATLLLSFAFSETSMADESQLTTDVPEDHWSYSAVAEGYINGLWGGYEDGSFGLGANITREEVAVIIDRNTFLIEQRLDGTIEPQVENANLTVTNAFSDIDSDHWAYEAIENGRQDGLWKGYDNGNFGMGESITRGEVAVIVQRHLEPFLEMIGELMNPYETDEAYFSDVPKSHWAYDAITFGQQLELWSGYDDGTFGVGEAISREEQAVIMDRINEVINTKLNQNHDAEGRIAFVSSALTNGNMGGVEGADEICKMLASEAGLGDNYMAWISDEEQSPSTRFDQTGGPFINSRGEVIAYAWNDLIDGELKNFIKYDENGRDSSSNFSLPTFFDPTEKKTVPLKILSNYITGLEIYIKMSLPPKDFTWTGTNASGEPVGSINKCINWTEAGEKSYPSGSSADLYFPNERNVLYGTGGNFTEIYEGWTDHFGLNKPPECAEHYRIYCFEQGEVEEVIEEEVNENNKTVFVTSEKYPGNFGGPETADSICQGRASLADLEGEFLALTGSNYEDYENGATGDTDDILSNHYDNGVTGYMNVNNEIIDRYDLASTLLSYNHHEPSNPNFIKLYHDENGNQIVSGDRNAWYSHNIVANCNDWSEAEEFINDEKKDLYGMINADTISAEARRSDVGTDDIYTDQFSCTGEMRLICIEK